MQYYTGVGSRKTPKDVLKLMFDIATQINLVLRSGHAAGADMEFEQGCDAVGMPKEIYLASHCNQAAMDIAAQYHPAWHLCSDYAKKLHGRNAFQVLGPKLDMPSEFLICWTPDGCISHRERTRNTGGTGTAISIADQYAVDISNLAIPSHRKRWEDWLRM